MSQEAHDQNSRYKQERLIDSLKKVGVEKPKTVLLHKELPVLGGWTVFPILSPLLILYNDYIDWIVFLDERSTIDPAVFTNLLKLYNHEQNIFIGKALRDQRGSKIHHFEKKFNLTYPDFSAGFVFSSSLAKTLTKEVDTISTFPRRKDVLHPTLRMFVDFPRSFTTGD
jgi:hypothetical protein